MKTARKTNELALSRGTRPQLAICFDMVGTGKRFSDPSEPIDLVYTWVDDKIPDYLETLSQYAKTKFDSDPSRTRDNLDLLRFSLRSVERNLPWVNRIFLITCRPQIPSWLNRAQPRLVVVHHDEFIPASVLPTFNSFAIISHLHRIPALSERFLYLEDDMLILSPTQPHDFFTPTGNLRVFERGRTPVNTVIKNRAAEKPWNLALATANALLDAQYGESARGYVNHLPLFIEKQRWAGMTKKFPENFASTAASKFRADGNLPPEYLYPHILLAEGLAERQTASELRRAIDYVPLENFWPLTAWHLYRANCTRAKWVTLNDNFGKLPSRITERLALSYLLAWFPETSSFEN